MIIRFSDKLEKAVLITLKLIGLYIAWHVMFRPKKQIEELVVNLLNIEEETP